MLSSVLTWIGAGFGLAVLLAMASGAFVADLDTPRRRRRRDDRDHSTAAPLG